MTRKPVQFFLLFTMTLRLITSSEVGHAQGVDPDFKKEQQFHNVYKKYNEQPTSAEAWEKALSNRSARTYTIQNKDTLWDVSQTFFGDSNYWPKVWSYNTEGIQNPHEINPNQALRFYAGNFEEPPTVGLAGLDSAPEAIPEQVIEKRPDGTAEAIKIPPPTKKSRPLVKNLPKSIPLYRLGAVNTPPVEFEPGVKRKIPTPKRFVSLYAADSEVSEVGVVVETEIPGLETASDYQYITVRLPSSSEKYFVAYDKNQTVKDPQSESSATIVEVQGEIEVLERVNASENIYRAFVLKTVNPLKVGAKLMPGRLTLFDVTATAPETNVQARIIGGESEKYQKIFGDDEFIFLSAGSNAGLREGSTLQVYMNERVRKPTTQAQINDRVIGLVKVVKVANRFATAFIIKAESDFVIGDYVGGALKTALAPTAGAEGNAEDDFKESEGTTQTDSLMSEGAVDAEAPTGEAGDTGESSSDDELSL